MCPSNHVLDGGPDPLTGSGTSTGNMRKPIVTYLHMSDMPVQWTQWTNAFATARWDKMVMQPFTKLLCSYKFTVSSSMTPLEYRRYFIDCVKCTCSVPCDSVT